MRPKCKKCIKIQQCKILLQPKYGIDIWVLDIIKYILDICLWFRFWSTYLSK